MMKLEDLLHYPNERVVYFLRHHWIVYAFPVALAVLLAIIPFIAGALLSTTSYVLNPSVTMAAVLSLGLSVYYLGIWLFLFTTFHNAYLDVWVVTTHRIVYIEQHQLFSRTVSEQPLSRVQDVTSDVRGILPTMLGYGDILVQTAGAVDKFAFDTIPNPTEVSRTIFQLVDDVRKREGEPPPA